MTNQTAVANRLGGSPAAGRILRFGALTLGALLFTGGVAAALGQANAADSSKTGVDTKPATGQDGKLVGGYLVHQALEVGGRITKRDGSDAMWDTLVNQGSGGRILAQSLEMHSMNPSKTPFFDTLSTNSTGYGGDPYDVSYFRMSKGRIYDFAGSFRRDRNYFDYNLLDNSLLSTATAANPVLVPEPDSLHLFNTVRRNTDTTLTLLPLSFISFRAGLNHGTHEGPSYTTVHYGPDTQEFQWFRNSRDTYRGGVDLKIARRTLLSYDQFYVFYKGDTSWRLTGTTFKLPDGTPVSLGVDTLANTTCGSGSAKTVEVVNGIANPFCNGATAESNVAPMRSKFPTEQFRFSSHYWDRVSFNGRLLYSGGTGNVNHFNQTFTGWTSRTHVRQEILTGAGPNGQEADNKRINTSGDFGVVADISKRLSVSDTFDYWNFRFAGNQLMNAETWVGTASTSMLTPLSDPSITHTPATALAPDPANLNQRIESNTLLATVTVVPQLKVSGGWRFKNRHIGDLNADGQNDITWHENGALVGGVFQASRVFRLNVNYDTMNSKYITGVTSVDLPPSNTFVRDAPNTFWHVRARATLTPAKWINFAVTENDYEGKNDDPLVNHKEHNHDFSIATQVIADPTLSFDFNYAHDDVYSRTDICYFSTAPLPGATNAGTCSLNNDPNSDPSFFLGTGFYDAPANFFSGSINYAPTKKARFAGGMRLNNVNGQTEMLNPLMVPGALHSRMTTPFADLEINIAPQWAWHGNWNHQGYNEAGGAGPAPRNFNGDIVTLGVKYAF